MIVHPGDQPKIEQELDVLLCWMDSKPLLSGNKYLFQINSRRLRASVKEIQNQYDVNTLEKKFGLETNWIERYRKSKNKNGFTAAF